MFGHKKNQEYQKTTERQYKHLEGLAITPKLRAKFEMLGGASISFADENEESMPKPAALSETEAMTDTSDTTDGGSLPEQGAADDLSVRAVLKASMEARYRDSDGL
jgi:hypothetical protein